MAHITVEIPDELAAWLTSRAAAHGVSEARLIQEALAWHRAALDPDLPDPERRARVAAAIEGLEAGRGVPHERVEAWLRARSAGHAAPPPR